MLLQPFQSYKAMHSRADDRPWKGNQQRGAATSAAIPAADVPIRIHGHPVTTSARRWAQRGRLVDESAPAAAAASNGGRRDARSGLDTYPMSPTVDDELHKYPTLLGVLRAAINARNQSTSTSETAYALVKQERDDQTQSLLVPEKRFFGQRIKTKTGRQNGLLYQIPGTNSVYTFYLQRRGKHYDVYRCIRCKSAGGSYVTIKATGDEFLCDPCLIEHHCEARTLGEDKTIRLMYDKMREIREDNKFASMSARQAWSDGLREIEEAVSEDNLKDEILSRFYATGYKSRKRQIARNLAYHKMKREDPSEDDHEVLEDGCHVHYIF